MSGDPKKGEKIFKSKCLQCMIFLVQRNHERPLCWPCGWPQTRYAYGIWILRMQVRICMECLVASPARLKATRILLPTRTQALLGRRKSFMCTWLIQRRYNIAFRCLTSRKFLELKWCLLELRRRQSVLIWLPFWRLTQSNKCNTWLFLFFWVLFRSYDICSYLYKYILL